MTASLARTLSPGCFIRLRTTPSNGATIVCSSRVRLASASSASAIPLVFRGFLDLGHGDLELSLGLGDVFGGHHARLRDVEPFVASHDRDRDILLGLGLLCGSHGIGLELVLADGQLGDLVVQDADHAILLDGHADLKLHLLDDALAQGGDVRLFDPVDPGQLFEHQGLGAGLPGRWADPPLWATAAAAESIKPLAASAAIDFDKNHDWNEPPRLQGVARPSRFERASHGHRITQPA